MTQYEYLKKKKPKFIKLSNFNSITQIMKQTFYSYITFGIIINWSYLNSS
ncbi:unnamed protein product [Paramecium sonneborni]|uniref:Uncharacterized protein n=1 Tax=Paramecium sonneborni TaxID=65129 RepID=A0A8S1K553_9CILI|nr:unnamed protein product [Paramecium sonneborni]